MRRSSRRASGRRARSRAPRARSMIRSVASGSSRAQASRSSRSMPSSSSQWRNVSTGVSVSRRFGADVQVRDQGRLLVDGDEAAAARLGRRVDDALAAADGDRARVRPHGAGEDLDEGALARAVGAHERVDLARPHGERRRLQRDDGAVASWRCRSPRAAARCGDGHQALRRVLGGRMPEGPARAPPMSLGIGGYSPGPLQASICSTV